MSALSILAALVALGERTTSDSTARSDSADHEPHLATAPPAVFSVCPNPRTRLCAWTSSAREEQSSSTASSPS